MGTPTYKYFIILVITFPCRDLRNTRVKSLLKEIVYGLILHVIIKWNIILFYKKFGILIPANAFEHKKIVMEPFFLGSLQLE